MTRRFVEDHRLASAPQPPTDRPPTKREAWEWASHVFKDTKTREDQITYARASWAGNYVHWVNLYGWKKQPDWTEGDPVIAAAVPRGPIPFGGKYISEVERLFQIAQGAAA